MLVTGLDNDVFADMWSCVGTYQEDVYSVSIESFSVLCVMFICFLCLRVLSTFLLYVLFAFHIKSGKCRGFWMRVNYSVL